MNPQGIERRRNRVYVTRNTEYHMRDNVCVGVRDRTTGRFHDAHLAVQMRLEGRIKMNRKGAIAGPLPVEVGDALFFLDVDPEGRPRQLTTSRVQTIDRPDRKDLGRYAA